jgi:hypothetical protein
MVSSRVEGQTTVAYLLLKMLLNGGYTKGVAIRNNFTPKRTNR